MSDAQAYRSRALSELTAEIGVYALCDLDGQPIYVGQSVDGIQHKVATPFDLSKIGCDCQPPD